MDRVEGIMEEGKPIPDLENLGFGGINMSLTAEEVGSVGGGRWDRLTESLDSLRLHCT